jgi:hypothetical protein
MSIYVEFGDDEPEQIASNKGWSEFGDWVESLNVKKYPQITNSTPLGAWLYKKG